jgi:hypothetical protein
MKYVCRSLDATVDTWLDSKVELQAIAETASRLLLTAKGKV